MAKYLWRLGATSPVTPLLSRSICIAFTSHLDTSLVSGQALRPAWYQTCWLFVPMLIWLMVSNIFYTNVWDYAQFECLFWMGKSDTLGEHYTLSYDIYIYPLSPSLWVVLTCINHQSIWVVPLLSCQVRHVMTVSLAEHVAVSLAPVAPVAPVRVPDSTPSL